MFHVQEMALYKCRGTVPLTIPLLKVSLSQLTTSFTRATQPHARAHAHTLMGVNLINCSETDTLSLINPFLRLRAHGEMVTIHHKTHKQTHRTWVGGERRREKKRERFVFTPRWEKKVVICQGDSTLKHPNYSDKATLFWYWIKYEWFSILLLCLWNINQPWGTLSSLLNICKLFYFGLVCFQWLLWIVFG